MLARATSSSGPRATASIISGLHAYNYADLPVWDMLFGTFRNPRPREIYCGFTDGAERRLLDMIRGKDVTA